MKISNRFRSLAGVSFVFAAVLLFAYVVSASEHPGSAVEHPGKAVEHGGKAITADSVKQAITSYADAQEKAHGGVFMIKDDKLNKTWKLKLAVIHDPVRMFEKGGQTIYFACSDFNSTEGKDVLDIDFWMVPKDGKLTVTESKIHKVNGEPRFTYEGTTLKEVK
ncbi:MAG: hypothetical protein ABSF90_21680 [Syntrophobacteraceae bacterium]|jgi:Cu/Ag efflux protein CusF